MIYYSKSSSNRIIREVWYNQGTISRLFNPAVIVYDQNGKHEAISKTYYINNEKFEIEVNEMVSNNARIQKLSIEIRQKSGEFIHSFYFYKEVADEI